MSAAEKRAKAILFSADPSMVDMGDAVAHLQTHRELYWSTGLRIHRNNFSFPILGFIHVNGQGGRYLAEINDIIPFSADHFRDASVKPQTFRDSWENDPRDRAHPWKWELVMTGLKRFVFDTFRLEKWDGGFVKKAPQGYVRVIPLTPDDTRGM
jgi:hypothetical protein